MKIPHYPYRCPLARLIPEPVDAEALKRDGWREQHILVVNEADTRLNNVERELVQRIGERLYGKEGRRHG
jgi:hypothetical protein